MRRILSPCFVPRAIYSHMNGECAGNDPSAEATEGQRSGDPSPASPCCLCFQDQYLCGRIVHRGADFEDFVACVTCSTANKSLSLANGPPIKEGSQQLRVQLKKERAAANIRVLGELLASYARKYQHVQAAHQLVREEEAKLVEQQQLVNQKIERLRQRIVLSENTALRWRYKLQEYEQRRAEREKEGAGSSGPPHLLALTQAYSPAKEQEEDQ